MNAPAIEQMTEAVQDVAHKVAERAPDLATAVGRGARSTAESVSDAVVRLAQMTPFVEAPKPQRHLMRWTLRAVMVATLAGLALWFANRRRTTARPFYEADQPAAEATGLTAERRYATAGR